MDGKIFISRIWALVFNMKNNVRRVIDPIVQNENLTPLQAYVLLEIEKGGVNNISGVCNDFGINQGNASTMCKKLEQAGLLLRERSEDDERVVILSVTDKGRKVLKKIEEQFLAFDEYCRGISNEKMNEILKGFNMFEELITDFILITEKNNERIF